MCALGVDFYPIKTIIYESDHDFCVQSPRIFSLTLTKVHGPQYATICELSVAHTYPPANTDRVMSWELIDYSPKQGWVVFRVYVTWGDGMLSPSSTPKPRTLGFIDLYCWESFWVVSPKDICLVVEQKPSEKYESQLGVGMIVPNIWIYIWNNDKCSNPPTKKFCSYPWRPAAQPGTAIRHGDAHKQGDGMQLDS